ncbi:hypothetical protein [Nannocystis pusilla]|uniref:hypothetical protein n=1 Tax=Nannocystis pusilla TaxID=889268 RepID=UPI003BF249AE
MSLLTYTQGRFEGVRSLVRLLHAHQGRMPRALVLKWMQPEAFQSERGATKPVEQLIGCARSLRLVEDVQRDLVLVGEPGPTDPVAFADRVHAILRDEPDPGDRVMFLVYAWFVVKIEQHGGTQWIADATVNDLTDEAEAALAKHSPDERADTFNSTRFSAWCSWIVALGLGHEAACLPAFFPHPSERLSRELPSCVRELGVNVEIPARGFLDVLKQRMPYLDGGAIWKDVAARSGFVPREKTLGRVLSEALRELHDEGRLQLIMRGDSAGAVALASDPLHAVATFSAVRLAEGEA